MDAQKRFAAARFARLATGSERGPHLVPVVFAMVDDLIVTAVDGKPKSTTQLRRLANIEARPEVTMLVDHAEEDWSRLWWVRVDGRAEVHGTDSAIGEAAVAALRAKYPQYAQVSLPGPVIALRPLRWSSWSATSADE